jgi:hypothetical protein
VPALLFRSSLARQSEALHEAHRSAKQQKRTRRAIFNHPADKQSLRVRSNHRGKGTGASRSHADTPAYTYAGKKKKPLFGWQLAACGQLRTHLSASVPSSPGLVLHVRCMSIATAQIAQYKNMKSACIKCGPPVPAWPVISCSAHRRTCWLIRRAPAGCEPWVVSRQSARLRACLAVRAAACSFPPNRLREDALARRAVLSSAIFVFLQRELRGSQCAATAQAVRRRSAPPSAERGGQLLGCRSPGRGGVVSAGAGCGASIRRIMHPQSLLRTLRLALGLSWDGGWCCNTTTSTNSSTMAANLGHGLPCLELFGRCRTAATP